jgi:hypothetical protein
VKGRWAAFDAAKQDNVGLARQIPNGHVGADLIVRLQQRPQQFGKQRVPLHGHGDQKRLDLPSLSFSHLPPMITETRASRRPRSLYRDDGA